MTGLQLGVIAGIVTLGIIAIVRRVSRRHIPPGTARDVGHVSDAWVAEHRAGTQQDRFS